MTYFSFIDELSQSYSLNDEKEFVTVEKHLPYIVIYRNLLLYWGLSQILLGHESTRYSSLTKQRY